MSLIDNPKVLLRFIRKHLKPKFLEKKKYGEVFTPMSLVNEMLDKLPNHVWKDPNLKWFDPAAGMGNFPIAVYLRLMESLKEKIPDAKKRKKHILENMIYMSELNKKNCHVMKEIFDLNGEYDLNIHRGDSLALDTEEEWKVDNFDIVLGNPPYNKEVTNRSSASPLYHLFIEKFIDNCHYLLFIVPSRWFAGGKGLDKFRGNMLKRRDLVFIKHFDDASKLFGNQVNIEGGVNYFLKDINHNGLCNINGKNLDLTINDILLFDNEYDHLLSKLSNYNKLSSIYQGRFYGIESNDKRLQDEQKNGFLRCYVSQQKGFVKYIDARFIQRNYNTWKIITPQANGGNQCFGNIFIGYPNEVHTGTYNSFVVKSEEEAKSLLSYLKCRLPNFLLSLRKISQSISERTIKWIPLPPLNREWIDDVVYDYFGLTDDEIDLIENAKIKGYKQLRNEIPKGFMEAYCIKYQNKDHVINSDVFSQFTEKQLNDIADDYELVINSRNKSDLIEKLVDALLRTTIK